VVEPSAGVDRTVLALICDAYDEDSAGTKGKWKLAFNAIHRELRASNVRSFPLRNKEPLVAKAREVQALLRPHMNVFYDEAARSVGAPAAGLKNRAPFG